MNLSEIGSLLSETRKEMAPFEVPEEERHQAMSELEIGKYPGDNPDAYLQSGRKDFEKLTAERRPIVEQVKKARVQTQEFKDRESITGQIKEFGRNLLAPHDVMPSAQNTPKPVTPSVVQPPKQQNSLTTSERFHVDEGEIIDTKRGMIITPDVFNRSATPAERSTIERQLQDGGFMDRATTDRPDHSSLESELMQKSINDAPPIAKAPPMTPDELHASPELFAKGITQKVDQQIARRKAVRDQEAENQSIEKQRGGLAQGEQSLKDWSSRIERSSSSIQQQERQYEQLAAKLQRIPSTVNSQEELDAAHGLHAEVEAQRQALNESVSRHNQLVSQARADNTSYNDGVGSFNASVTKANARPPLVTPSDTPLDQYPSMEKKEPLSLGQAFHEFGNATLRGMGQTGASALKGVGAIAYEVDQAMKIDDKTHVGDYATFQAGTKIAKLTEEMFPGRKDLQDSFLLTTVPQALGSSIVFLAAGAAGAAVGAGAGTTAAMGGALVGGASLYEKGMKANVSQEQRRLGLAIGATLGLTEGIPIADLFRRLNTATGGTLTTALKVGTVQAIEEALQEGFQQIGENIAVKQIYGQAQEMMDGVKEGMGAGGLIGFLTGAILARKGRYGSSLEQEQSSSRAQTLNAPAMVEGAGPGPKTSGPVQHSPFTPAPKPKPAAPVTPEQFEIAPLPMKPAGQQMLIKKQPSPAVTPEAIAPIPQAPIAPQVTQAVEVPQVPQDIAPDIAPNLSAEAQAARLPAPQGMVTIEEPMPTFADGSPIQVPYRQPIDITPPKQPLPPASVQEIEQSSRQPVSPAVALEDDGGAAPIETEEVAQSIKAPSVDDIHDIADRLGLSWDNSKPFMNFTEQVTGKKHLDDLEPMELLKLLEALEDYKPVSLPEAKPAVAQTPEQIVQDRGYDLEGKAIPRPATPTDIAAHQASTSPTNAAPVPTPEQVSAGNYRKGHVSIAGLDISIENPAGSIRSGTDKSGKPWSQEMKDHYGYIRGTKGKDKEHIDVFVKPGTPEDYSGPVFVMDQRDASSQRFDEHKIIMGAANSREARALYSQNYSKGWNGAGSLSTFTMPQFKEWLKSGNHQKPAVEYKVPRTPTPGDIEQATSGQDILTDVHTRAEEASKGVTPETLPPGARREGDRVYNKDGSYYNVEPKRFDQARYRQLKTALTKAEKSGDQDKIIQTASSGLEEFERLGSYPDDWSRWERAKEDAELKKRRQQGDPIYTAPITKPLVPTPEQVGEKPKEKHEAINKQKEFRKALVDWDEWLDAHPDIKQYWNSNLQRHSRGTAQQITFERQWGFDEAERENPSPSSKQSDAAKDLLSGRSGKLPDAKSADEQVSAYVAQVLESGRPLSKEDLFGMADTAFAGTQAQGKYTPKDAYDALELGINQFILDRKDIFDAKFRSYRSAQLAIKAARDLIIDKIPTQTRRTDEQVEFQQFSTPPDLAYTMAWVANLKPSDVVLEPSAGIGGIAVFAKNAGATVHVNELSDRRADLLKTLGFKGVTTENAEQIHNILPSNIKPTVVLMNPPFSSTAGRIEGQRKAANVLTHLDQALKRLEPGGRLVALIGKGKMYADPKVLEDWIADTAKQYAYRARVGISGKNYKKYGTSYDNQIIIYDKIAPDGKATVIATVEDVIEAIPLLKEVRDARHYGSVEAGTTPDQLTPAEPTRQAVSETGTPTARPGRAVPPAVSRVGSRESQDLTPESAVGGARPRVTPTPGDLDTGGRAQVSDTKPGRSGKPASVPTTTAKSDVGTESREAGTERAGSENDGGSKRGLPAEQVSTALTLEASQVPTKQAGELTDSVYDSYTPRKAKVKGSQAHPGKLVESAALAAVEPPDVSYRPHIPEKLIKRGDLSDAQLEAVVYAGEAHSHMLPSEERKGYLIGDGPGVGKGRTLAGIILDNWVQGRKKAVWLSETQNLGTAAVRDWTAMEQKESDILSLNKFTRDQPIDRKQGILYTTYTTLSSGLESMAGGGLKAKQAKGAPVGTQVKTRLDQVLNWLGPDFDGVIILDEAHNMQNSLEREGERGDIMAAAKALAGVTLQQRLPKARIVYSSATAATRVDALAFADRLGLWGEGTPFANKSDFVSSIESSGLGAMEIVAQNMKAMGSYMSRNLDYSGVKYRKLEHALTEDQQEIYDAMAKGWQVVLQNLDKAMEASGITGTGRSGEKKTLNGRAKGAAYAKFWGANQRFFNQILTSMQLPSVVSDMKKQLENGKSILVQLVNTNEAVMERQIKSAEQSGQDLDAIDMTPRQNLRQYVEHSFPTAQFEQYTEPGSTTIKSRLVMDSQGRPVQNAEAVKMKENLLAQIESMRVPEGPLEILLNTFGPQMVAEVTGRKERLVRLKNEEDGSETTQLQKRTPSMITDDVKSFMGGKKRILVFSDKGGTGESYHADKTKKNQQQRIHYLLQPGWRADKAVQGLGRSHRTNQASEPEYVLTMTNIKGHKRFISTIARRLDQLGALTKGQRQAGSSGLIEAKDNLENKYAAGAVRHFFLDMFTRNAGDFNFGEVTKKLGLNNLVDKDGSLIQERLPGVPQFLNRMLSLELTDQNRFFDEFYGRMERAVDLATQAGTLDTGMETFRADGGITLKEETEIHRDPQSKASVMLGQYEAKHSVDFLPAKEVEESTGFKRYLTNNKTGKVWAQYGNITRTTDAGNVVSVTRLQSPVTSQYVDTDEIARLYKPVDKPEARAAWQKQIDEHPPFRTEKFYLATGNILRIWDRFPKDSIAKIRRIQTTDGKKALGRIIPQHAVETMMVKLGKSEKAAPTLNAEGALDAVLDDGSTLTLANDWQIKRVRVNQEHRLEVVGTNLYKADDQLKGYGVFTETIQYSRRYFIPTEKDAGEQVMERIIKNRPIIDVIKRGMDILKEERGSIPVSPFKAPAFTKEAREHKAMRAKEEMIGFSSTDEEIESRVRAAKRGLKPEGIWERVKAHGEEVWQLASREFEHLPDTATFSTLRTDLLRLAKYKGIAADQVQRDLAAIIKPLSRKQYDQFEWKALLADLSREAEQDRALPFGYTKEKVQEDLDRLDQVIERDPMVQKAWAARQALWAKKKKDYQDAMDAIGFDTSKKLTKDDYFRHQVLEHARERHLSGTGAKVRTPTGRGFLQKRSGSTMDINANYVQAEFEVMTQMVYDTQLAKVIAHVDRDLNIRKSLEMEAKTRNADALQRKIDEGGIPGAIIEATMTDFRRRIGMHMGMAKKALNLQKGDRLTLEELADIADDPDSPANASARGVFKAISERKQYVKDLLAHEFKTWDQLVPDTHDIWQPREGNVFYMADSIPAQLAKALQEGMLAEIGIDASKLRKIMAQGGKREEYVIPVEAKATLDDLAQKPKHWFVRANSALISHWKQLMLIAPRRVIRYNVRNLTGDGEAMFVGNPRAFLKMKQAAGDLIPVIFKDTVLTGEAKEWSQRGGYGTTLQMQELGDINDLKAFKASLDKQSQGGFLKAPAAVWNAYWKTARLSTDYREAMMRYSTYLDYLEQMQQHPKGRPKNFGASIPETVMALPDLRDRAFKMSNELLGAYDRVSVAGQNLRQFWVPFWSWQEVNATRYYRLVRNAFDGQDAGGMARGATVSTVKAATFLIKMSMFWSTLQAWNLMMYGDDEDELRETNPTVANRPHILFGRDESGKIRYLAGIGALGDLLAWFGLDAAPGMVGDVMHDRLTIGEALMNVAKAPVNKIVGGLTPTLKMPVELLSRQNFYPDPFHPRPIQDRGDYIGQQTTFGPEINAVRGKPGKPLYGGDDLTGLLIQRSDPKAGAYGTWQGIERKYLERMGKDSSAMFWRSPRGEALSNWSRAIKDEDHAAELHWKGEYERLEREKHGQKFSETKMMSDLERSLRAKAPLAGVTKAERDAIVKELDSQEKRTLEKAEDYYKDVILQVLPESRRRAFTSRLQRQHWLSPSESFAPHELP